MNLLIDSSFIFYRTYFTAKKIGYENDYNFIFNKFIKDVFFLIKIFEVNENLTHFVFDSHSWRKKICNNYKSNREKKSDEFYQTLDKCYNYLKELGYNTYKINEAEADDVIYLLSKKIKTEIIVITSDEDLRQIINNKISIYNPNTKILYYLKECEKRNFIKNYIKINPKKILIDKILKGDKSDNIKSLNLRLRKETINNLYDLEINKIQEIICDNNIELNKKFELNKNLVRLHEDELPITIINIFNNLK